MGIIHQYIPAWHVESFLNTGLHFTPCIDFIDVLEFRLAWCFFNRSARTWRELVRCVGQTFQRSEVNASIEGACISCWSGWSRGNSESSSMWELYGKGPGAIRVSVDSRKLVRHVEQTQQQVAGVGRQVSYGFLDSMVRPPFARLFNGLTAQQHEEYDLFFQKHQFYSYEDEFRIVLYNSGPLKVPIPPELVDTIIFR